MCPIGVHVHVYVCVALRFLFRTQILRRDRPSRAIVISKFGERTLGHYAVTRQNSSRRNDGVRRRSSCRVFVEKRTAATNYRTITTVKIF